jgi:signal transduction histidine kinase
MPWKIRTKLVLTFLAALLIAVVTLVGALAVGIVVIQTHANVESISFIDAGRIIVQHGPKVATAVTNGASPAEIQLAAVPQPLPVGVRIRVIDNSARVWVDTDGGAGRTATGAEMMEWVRSFTDKESRIITMPQEITVNGKSWGFYGVTYTSPYGLTFNLNQNSRQNRLAAIVFLVGLALPLTVNIALFWAFGWHIVKPLQRLSSVVSQIAAGDLTARTELGNRRDELGQFAHDLDQMTTRLGEAREQAATAEKARRYLVAAVSHDLRTPLTALLAHAEAVRTGVSEDQAQSIAIIEEKGLLLNRLIGDLFELAALDATQQRWQLVRIDLAELVRQSVLGILPELEAASMEVDADIPEEPLWANLAPGKLERVMDNLIANARKYGDSGRWIGVRVNRLDSRIRVEVANHGPAIPEELFSHLFERFYRSDTARSTTDDGSGLGLAIAREIVVRHNGQIGVENPPEGGVRFWFEVPAI